ncbi:hypothetical protein BC826DRAFT_410363 [Russula brevipes]|nr:hypothetical protein BC826DRAFT_410363 [Russula brevipes]
MCTPCLRGGDFSPSSSLPQPPPDGIQDVIWAFSPTPPESADSDAHISVHHRFGRTHLNLTRTAAASDDAPSPSPSPSPAPLPSPVLLLLLPRRAKKTRTRQIRRGRRTSRPSRIRRRPPMCKQGRHTPFTLQSPTS